MNVIIAVFYYTLANIRPEFRSKLSAIQLLAVAKADDIHTYGCDALLEPFVTQMKLLRTVPSMLFSHFAVLRYFIHRMMALQLLLKEARKLSFMGQSSVCVVIHLRLILSEVLKRESDSL